GIGACFKHFPGHGDTQTDSHLGLPVIQKTREELEQEELLPFQYGIDKGVEMIMVGHLAAPALSGGKEIAASISREII
ncbi:glycoside hydrolase family 3 N-terminal domain-containing protein, partial [Campylobacter fetus subsp. venerealis]